MRLAESTSTSLDFRESRLRFLPSSASSPCRGEIIALNLGVPRASNAQLSSHQVHFSRAYFAELRFACFAQHGLQLLDAFGIFNSRQRKVWTEFPLFTRDSQRFQPRLNLP